MERKRLRWVGSSIKDYKAFPDEVQDVMGYALDVVQCGKKPLKAKPFKGLGGGVLELVSDYQSDTYRAVYTVRFEDVVYVLHAFQKKSKKGIATPKQDVDLIKLRLKQAQTLYSSNFKK